MTPIVQYNQTYQNNQAGATQHEHGFAFVVFIDHYQQTWRVLRYCSGCDAFQNIESAPAVTR